MASLCCLLIGNELIDKMRKCDKAWGYIDGFVSGDVIGAVKVDLGGLAKETCIASLTILNHRNRSAEYKEKLICWIKVKDGVLSEIRNYNTKLSDISEWASQDVLEIIQQSEIEYLLFVEENSKKSLFAFSFEIEKDKVIFIGELLTLEDNMNSFERLDGLVPLEDMKEKQVVIVGLGSGGSPIAIELASAGIGTLHLFDKDRLTGANLFRHVCGIRDLGRKKVDAVADVIKDQALPTKTINYSYDIISYPEKLVEAIQQADIVVCATDNPQSRAMVNYACVKFNKNLILACTFDNARIGEIIKVVPNQTGCYECTRLHLRERGMLIDDENRNEVLPYSSQSESASGNSRGTRTDVFIVAAMAAKATLMTLKPGRENGFGDLNFSYISWGAVRNMEFFDPFRFRYPFTTNYINFNIHPKCPICGTLTDGVLDISIEDKYNEIIQKL